MDEKQAKYQANGYLFLSFGRESVLITILDSEIRSISCHLFYVLLYLM